MFGPWCRHHGLYTTREKTLHRGVNQEKSTFYNAWLAWLCTNWRKTPSRGPKQENSKQANELSRAPRSNTRISGLLWKRRYCIQTWYIPGTYHTLQITLFWLRRLLRLTQKELENVLRATRPCSMLLWSHLPNSYYKPNNEVSTRG